MAFQKLLFPTGLGAMERNFGRGESRHLHPFPIGAIDDAAIGKTSEHERLISMEDKGLAAQLVAGDELREAGGAEPGDPEIAQAKTGRVDQKPLLADGDIDAAQSRSRKGRQGQLLAPAADAPYERALAGVGNAQDEKAVRASEQLWQTGSQIEKGLAVQKGEGHRALPGEVPLSRDPGNEFFPIHPAIEKIGLGHDGDERQVEGLGHIEGTTGKLHRRRVDEKDDAGSPKRGGTKLSDDRLVVERGLGDLAVVDETETTPTDSSRLLFGRRRQKAGHVGIIALKRRTTGGTGALLQIGQKENPPPS